MHSDDKSIADLSVYEGMDIVVSVKMDGENTNIYSDGYLHARSLDSQHNFTRDWAKRMASILCHDIPDGYRFIFENVAYYHSVFYDDLDSFCYLLSIWDDNNYCLSFDDTQEYAELLDLAMPKILYRGKFDLDVLKKLSQTMDLEKDEGFVFRNVESFHFDDFSNNIGKFVRPNHVQDNSEHWLKNTKPNLLTKNLPIKPFYMN
jgi:hypothetical protein